MTMRQSTITGPAIGRALALIALALLVLLSVKPSSVVAQERYYERRSVLDFFFGRRYRPEDEPPRRYYPDEPRRPKPPRRQSAPKTVAAPRPAAPAEPEQAAVRKLDSARKILVVGDFLAGGLGEGLDEAFSDSPGIVVDARTTVASGLVRDDFYSWPSQLPKMIDDAKPALVVVMLGANDRQQMVTDVGKEKFRTDAWFAEYRQRVDGLAKLVANRKIPLLWVGLPPFDSGTMSADALTLNQLFRTEVEKLGGEFVDVWDGFTNEDGDFVLTGSDINGQQVRLRAADGINLTPPGRRKLAFYVEKPARRILGSQASPDLGRIDADGIAKAPVENPAQQTQPISFTDPNFDGGKVLLGDTAPAPKPPQPSPRDMLVQQGKLPPAPAGRVDDYRMPDDPKPSAVPAKP